MTHKNRFSPGGERKNMVKKWNLFPVYFLAYYGLVIVMQCTGICMAVVTKNDAVGFFVMGCFLFVRPKIYGAIYR